MVTLDMKKILRAETVRLSSKNLSEDKMEAAIDALPQRLDQALKTIFKNQKPLVLKPGAVVTSLKDITPAVLKTLEEAEAS